MCIGEASRQTVCGILSLSFILITHVYSTHCPSVIVPRSILNVASIQATFFNIWQACDPFRPLCRDYLKCFLSRHIYSFSIHSSMCLGATWTPGLPSPCSPKILAPRKQEMVTELHCFSFPPICIPTE